MGMREWLLSLMNERVRQVEALYEESERIAKGYEQELTKVRATLVEVIGRNTPALVDLTTRAERAEAESVRLGLRVMALEASADQRTNAFRWQVLRGYGFNATAWGLLCDVPLTILDWDGDLMIGGGLTFHDVRIELNTPQHEAAVHEFCHWVWEHTGLRDAALVARYLQAYTALAADVDASPAARDFARVQLYGEGSFAGVLALGDNDHAFTSLCSWTMGQFKTGSRTLPLYMWPFLETVFIGEVKEVPYYEGGHR